MGGDSSDAISEPLGCVHNQQRTPLRLVSQIDLSQIGDDVVSFVGLPDVPPEDSGRNSVSLNSGCVISSSRVMTHWTSSSAGGRTRDSRVKGAGKAGVRRLPFCVFT
jgi:pSer/pThr/pTyr-binding forkhead associated (FHA) protein